MYKPSVDIVVPVWNRPVETRNCLVNLLNNSPDARFIMVDNGSDRETERLLQEFSEGLDDRALLLRNDVNQGFVKAVNKGLEKGEAAFLAVIRSTSQVGPGWLEPCLDLFGQREDAGIVVPRLVQTTGSGRRNETPLTREVSHGSFAALLLRKALFDAVGGFDEQMDGGLWCLKDYSRRGGRAGFFTFSVAGGSVRFVEEVPLGSVSRREEAVNRAASVFRERWGEEAAYCLVVPRDVTAGEFMGKIDLLLQGARNGLSFTVFVDSKTHRQVKREGYLLLHEQLAIEPLPLLFSGARTRKLVSGVLANRPGTLVVADMAGKTFVGVESHLRFMELEHKIRSLQ